MPWGARIERRRRNDAKRIEKFVADDDSPVGDDVGDGVRHRIDVVSRSPGNRLQIRDDRAERKVGEAERR